jgi:hypothetical protein
MHFLSRSLMMTALAALAALANAALGEAQTLRFQLQPLCDKVTLTLVPSPSKSVIGIVGYDDNCGENPRSPVHGTAVLNPDGGISIGYTTSLPVSVYGRTDVGLQTNVEWPADSNVGFWTDDDGNSGKFVFEILDQPSG